MEPDTFQSIANQHLKVGISGGGGCYTAEIATTCWEEAINQFPPQIFKEL